jgi:DNA-directed RNA polymerase subunit H (RpoH/RPB5)
MIISALAISGIAHANVMAGPQEDILAKAADAKKGVIVAVTERGNIAADTAWLLSAQVQKSNDYAPLLVVLKPEDRDVVLKKLKLVDDALPALIFFDRRGNEISRVIGAYPTASLKKLRAVAAAP